jgi:CDP-diacylglycerol--glycerol-3-phosphate 3-phosphatidyltransferase/cardiolipin synthase
MLTLPNILTLSRIFAVPLLLWLLWWPRWEFGYGLAFGLYCLMGITDYFDGYLARASGTVSKLGIFLDPIADKVMVAAVILILVDNRDIQGLHVIAALIILLREIMVSGLREFLAGLKVSVPVSKLAKWKTTLQLVSLGALILGGAIPYWHAPDWVAAAMAPVHSGLNNSLPHYVGVVSLWGAAILTLVTGWDYLRAGIKHMD